MKDMEDSLEGDQEVAVNQRKSTTPRTRDGRLRTRLRRLQAIAESDQPGGDQVSRAIRALRTLSDDGGRNLAHIKVRSNFVTRRAQAAGEMSDRRPPEGLRPPVLELISPRGIAQQLELVALFVAQCSSPHLRDRRVSALGLNLEPTDANEVSWIDVIVPHAENTARAAYAANRRDSRLRQVKRALDTLTFKNLVNLPNAGSARGKYDDFQLLDEGGPRLFGDPLVYRVPKMDEAVMNVPIDFFFQGWVYVLTKSEVALYLMLRHLSGLPTADGNFSPVSIFGDDRLRRYGVGKDAYKGWWMLQLAGLIEVEVDPARRSNGTVVGFDPADPPSPHVFHLQDAGLGRPSAAAVKAALATALDHEPIGVARVSTRETGPFSMQFRRRLR